MGQNQDREIRERERLGVKGLKTQLPSWREPKGLLEDKNYSFHLLMLNCLYLCPMDYVVTYNMDRFVQLLCF